MNHLIFLCFDLNKNGFLCESYSVVQDFGSPLVITLLNAERECVSFAKTDQKVYVC